MLENELVSIQQNKLTVNQYFTKFKTLCEQITKLDPENPITETKMRRTIVRGLKPSLNGLVTAIRGWATQPTLIEFENVLTNQEALDNQMSGVSIKDEETALFGNKNLNKSGEKISQSSNPLPGKSNQKSGGFQKGRGKGGFHQEGAQD